MTKTFHVFDAVSKKYLNFIGTGDGDVKYVADYTESTKFIVKESAESRILYTLMCVIRDFSNIEWEIHEYCENNLSYIRVFLPKDKHRDVFYSILKFISYSITYSIMPFSIAGEIKNFIFANQVKYIGVITSELSTEMKTVSKTLHGNSQYDITGYIYPHTRTLIFSFKEKKKFIMFKLLLPSSVQMIFFCMDENN